MGFVSSGFLFALPLVAVPVLIHLLNRRRKQVIRWGAMKFLLESSTRRRRFWRIDDLLVMLLRAVAILLIVLALARPEVWSNWLGSPTGRDVTLIIDNSLSTSLQSESGQVFDRVLETASDVITELHDGDDVRIMLALGSPKWMTPVAATVSAESRQQLQLMLTELHPSQATANIPAAVAAAFGSESRDSSLSRHVIVITDSCAHGWAHDAAARWNVIRNTIESSGKPTVVNVVTLSPERPQVNNLSIDRIESTRNTVGVNEPFSVTAQVSNSGASPGKPTILRWSADGEPLGVASVPALLPGQSSSVQLQHVIEGHGAYRIQCHLDHSDDVSLDDSGTTVVDAKDRVPLLIVQSAAGDRNELHYLLAALGRPLDSGVPELRESVFAPTLVRIKELPTTDLTPFRAVMIINAESIPQPVQQQLTDYVSTGGGLWILLGDRTVVSTFNSEIYNDGRGISPLPVLAPVGNADDREKLILISPPATDYRPTALLGDTQRLDIDEVHIYRHVPFAAGSSDDEARVLLETEHGAPLAIERHLGDGRIILMGLPLDAGWSNLPLCQSYVAMVHEWLWHLTEPSATQRNLMPGFPIRLPVDEFDQEAAEQVAGTRRGLQSGPEAIIEIPGGEQRVISATEAENAQAFVFRDTHYPGNYAVTLTGTSDGSDSGSSPFSVSRDAAESNFEQLTAAQRESLTANGGIRFVSRPSLESPGSVASSSLQPLASLLLSALLIVLLSEVLLAGWSASRRFDSPQS